MKKGASIISLLFAVCVFSALFTVLTVATGVIILFVALYAVLSIVCAILRAVESNRKEAEALENTAPEAVELVEEGEEDRCFTDLLRGRTVSKAIADEERKLLALYRRKDKLEAINRGDPTTWERFQKSKTWRGLLWDIEDTENTLKRLESIN